MGLFNKKIETTQTTKQQEKEAQKHKKDLMKQLEQAEQKAKELEAQRKIEEEKANQKKQMNENEEIINFEDEEDLKVNEDVLVSEISKLLDNNGLEETLNYLDSIKNNLIVNSLVKEEKPEVPLNEEKVDTNELSEEFSEI